MNFSEKQNYQIPSRDIPVRLQDECTGYEYDAVLHTCGNDVAYLKSEYALRPGRRIRIKINDVIRAGLESNHLASVVWRRIMTGDPPSYTYAMGVKYH